MKNRFLELPQVEPDDLDVQGLLWDIMLDDESAQRALSQIQEDEAYISSRLAHLESTEDEAGTQALREQINDAIKSALAGLPQSMTEIVNQAEYRIDQLGQTSAWHEIELNSLVPISYGRSRSMAKETAAYTGLGAATTGVGALAGGLAVGITLSIPTAVIGGIAIKSSRDALNDSLYLRAARDSIAHLEDLASRLHSAREDVDHYWRIFFGEERLEQ